MDYLKKESWVGFRESEMAQLEFASQDSVFIFTEVECVGVKDTRVLFADSFDFAAGYFMHVYLCDLIGDAIDAQRFDLSYKSSEHFRDTLFLGALRKKAISAMKSAEPKERLLEVIGEFNLSQQFGFQCFFKLCFGADELRETLADKFGDNVYFDCERLEKICTKESFNGAELKEYIKKLTIE